MSTVDKKIQSEVRTKYLNSITAKILGPGSEPLFNSEFAEEISHEIISESPKNRYITGMLFPKVEQDNFSSDEAADEAAGVQDEFDPESEPAIVDNSFKPSSMGLTFYCNNQNKIKVYLSGATYQIEQNPRIYLPKDFAPEFKQIVFDKGKMKDIIDYSDEDNSFAFTKKIIAQDPSEGSRRLENFLAHFNDDRTTEKHVYRYLKRLCMFNEVKEKIGKPEKLWVRKPFQQTVYVNTLKDSDGLEIEIDGKKSGLVLFSKVVRLHEKNVMSPTFVLMNNNSQKMFYQCQICVHSDDDFHFIASEDVHTGDINRLSKEDARLQFSYQDRKTYAFGHGVSATWKAPDSYGIPTSIATTYVPVSEITPMKFTIDGMDPKILRPDSYLQENNLSSQINMMHLFVNAYDDWIRQEDIESSKYTNGNKKYKEFAEENLNKCRTCSERMKVTIKKIENDEMLLKVFDLANEAILMQRIQDPDLRKTCYKKRDYSVIQESNDRFMWRPFQLAFILTTLSSVIDQEDSHRDDLDLIWVTTGGGKTEAYLFAIAASILYQRLVDPKSRGVSVIMRYTLRLLTAQQFDRAAALICTLEFMRRCDNQLGSNAISIGLWVGGATTPNKSDKAEKTLKDMIDNDGPNGFQILKCPWCHKEESLIPSFENKKYIYKWGYYPAALSKDYDMCCLNPDCDFSKKLPIYVVDTTIYKQQPTLLFGTVDKFAQVPINGDTANLFCAHSTDDTKIYLPRLIIQDELHLISGPLGSVVGLYEAGFDYILSQHGNRPKYLASTATIRNSNEQVNNLYGRSVIQFPPDGLRSDDSFFVSPANSKVRGREYLGVMGTGKSQVTAEVHMFAAMLASIHELNLPDPEKDLFWTTVGYFNSIRELGKASTLLVDDVQDELRNLAKRRHDDNGIRFLKRNVELTSRIKSSKITQTISDLEINYNQGYTVDTVIATNMLSVGIDISRLNAMLVVGQPKLTSEYIQATSRVGRNTLGVVFTLYNAMRSRDRSHYETFTSYHKSMYRYVEPSSVTPFSQPSLKRALAAALVTMIRYSVPELKADDSAVKIVDHLDEIVQVRQFILNRIKENDDNGLYLTSAQKILDDVIQEWILKAKKVQDLGIDKLEYYLRGGRKGNTQYLLVPYSGDCQEDEIPVMNSMRDIEETTHMEVKGDVSDQEI